jgi:hypothetical protein
MTDRFSANTLFGGVAIAMLCATGAAPALAQDGVVEGVYALPGVAQAVTGQLNVVEIGPLTRRIELTYADQSSGEQIAEFDVELTQQLHILATDVELTHLIHEHADIIGADGRFTAELEFPAPGLYHIYTDAVPAGIGQQVMRFDVTVGEVAPAAGTTEPAVQHVSHGPLVSSDGAYSVVLDASQLQVGVPSMVSLLVKKDGAPAADLEPYLGVSAHAVFIRAEDLAYVHAHAMEAGAEERHHAHGAEPAAPPGGHDHGVEAEADGHDAHASHQPDDHDAAPVTRIDPNMSLHVTPPAAGTYALWIEFIGGGEIRTVPFTIEIPEADSHASH